MNKGNWNILGALVAIVILCLLITVTGCEKDVPQEPEVGQVWISNDINPFDGSIPYKREIIALKDGYVQYIGYREGCDRVELIYSSREDIFMRGNKVIETLVTDDAAKKLNEPDIALDELEVGQVWEEEPHDNPFREIFRHRILELKDGYVKYRFWSINETEKAGEPLLEGNVSEYMFRFGANLIIAETPSIPDVETVIEIEPEIATDPVIVWAWTPDDGQLRWMWDDKSQDEGHLELVIDGRWIVFDDLVSEPNIPVWGKGELPADFAGFFGTDNNARLNKAQNDILNKHHVVIHGMDRTKDGKKVHLNGIIDLVGQLDARLTVLEAVDPNEVME